MTVPAPSPYTRVQRTRSPASPPHSPLTRRPLGGASLDRGAARWCAFVCLALVVVGCRDENWSILSSSKEYLASAPNQRAGVPSDTTPPRCLSRANPVVPPACRKASVQGKFVWQAEVTETGTVSELRMLKAPSISPPCPAFEAAVRKAMLGSRYEVTKVNGLPVPVVMTIEQTISVQ